MTTTEKTALVDKVDIGDDGPSVSPPLKIMYTRDYLLGLRNVASSTTRPTLPDMDFVTEFHCEEPTARPRSSSLQNPWLRSGSVCEKFNATRTHRRPRKISEQSTDGRKC
ncbi:hypothetical protein HDE_10166 [Halotydeus destructor]|nr:hypothetical protein HDE_10166 [Halotydeus destructor]